MADEVKVCNCAECGDELIISSTRNEVGGRINGRPYCKACIEAKPRPTTLGTSGPVEEIDPWQENNIRAMEDNE